MILFILLIEYNKYLIYFIWFSLPQNYHPEPKQCAVCVCAIVVAFSGQLVFQISHQHHPTNFLQPPTPLQFIYFLFAPYKLLILHIASYSKQDWKNKGFLCPQRERGHLFIIRGESHRFYWLLLLLYSMF